MTGKQALFYASVAMELMGLGIAASALSPQTLDAVLVMAFGPGQPPVTPGAAQLGVGIAGAVMAGWGTTMALIAKAWPTLAPRAVANAFLAGFLLWFLTDNAVSLTVGAHWNVVGNTVFLAMVALPLLKLRGE